MRYVRILKSQGTQSILLRRAGEGVAKVFLGPPSKVTGCRPRQCRPGERECLIVRSSVQPFSRGPRRKRKYSGSGHTSSGFFTTRKGGDRGLPWSRESYTLGGDLFLRVLKFRLWAAGRIPSCINGQGDKGKAKNDMIVHQKGRETKRSGESAGSRLSNIATLKDTLSRFCTTRWKTAFRRKFHRCRGTPQRLKAASHRTTVNDAEATTRTQWWTQEIWAQDVIETWLGLGCHYSQ